MLQSAIHNLESTFCNLQSAICMPGHDTSGSSCPEKKSPTVLPYVINSIDITIMIAIDTIDDMLIIPTRRGPTRCGWTINVLPSTRRVSNNKTGRRRWKNIFLFPSKKFGVITITITVITIIKQELGTPEPESLLASL